MMEVMKDRLPVHVECVNFKDDANFSMSEEAWVRWMEKVLQAAGENEFLDMCAKSFRGIRDTLPDSNPNRHRKNPWIDMDFTSLGEERRVMDGAENRGITLPQLLKLMRFIASHADYQRWEWKKRITPPGRVGSD